MEHLVESHMGGYYISNNEPEVIEKYCDTCCDYDHIILSYEEGKKFEALLEYVSIVEMSYKELEEYKNKVTLEELIDRLSCSYDEYRYLIYDLTEDNIINLKERAILLKQITRYQKKQFELLKSACYSNGYPRVKKYKKAKQLNK